MSYTAFKGTFLSTNQIDKVHYYICEPESEIQAIIQFAHGWVDCFERNKEIIDYFTSHGIMVCGCDFIGHDLERKEKCVDFKKKNAWTYLVNDLVKLSRYIRKTYPGIPFYLYGHGLGSIVARITVVHENQYDGLIISGTSGRQPLCGNSVIVSRILKFIMGPSYQSSLIELLMQNKVNYRYLKEKDDNAWVCSDPDRRIANNMSKNNEQFYSMAALRDMFHMLSMVSSKEWYRSVPRDLPALLISGEDDPVGAYGKGVREVERKLKKAGCNVETHIYKGMRHNLQDEPRREEVFNDILRWMNK